MALSRYLSIKIDVNWATFWNCLNIYFCINSWRMNFYTRSVTSISMYRMRTTAAGTFSIQSKNMKMFLNFFCIIFVLYHKCLFLLQAYGSSMDEKASLKDPHLREIELKVCNTLLLDAGVRKISRWLVPHSCSEPHTPINSGNSGKTYVKTFDVKYCCWASYSEKKN